MRKGKRRHQQIGGRMQKPKPKCSISHFISLVFAFACGCMLCSVVILNSGAVSQQHHDMSTNIVTHPGFPTGGGETVTSSEQMKGVAAANGYGNGNGNGSAVGEVSGSGSGSRGVLAGLRILIAIASYDFSQFPLLEEVLDSYQDACVAGAHVDLYIHTVVPYTVALIDMLNARYSCKGFQITIAVQSPAVRLNLVDRHRTLFYEKIDDFDLFIYSEDDIKVSPTTMMAYLEETKRVEQLVGKSPAEDYNIGIVRYEYNYPPDVIIDDKTRHATQNVTRVYWEHPWKPLFPKCIDIAPQEEVQKKYVTMQNHHQGMFLATRDLLKAWKVRKGCEFDVIRQRPGRKDKPSQPTEGTQRVWMSSQMLHGSRHCNVQQLIPMKTFGQLTVWHLPNKNYRRVGKKGRIGGSDSEIENEFGTGKERFRGPDPSLPTEMQLHLEMRKLYPLTADLGSGSGSGAGYRGIKMIDEVDRGMNFRRSSVGDKAPYMDMLDERLRAYEEYVKRGGTMVEEDFTNWQWIPDYLD